MNEKLPIPENEMKRAICLSDYDLDYAAMQTAFEPLTRLAAAIADTEISVINLIDTFTQWTVSQYGLPLEQMPREDSVCQYAILDKKPFEIKDLSADKRFADKDYVLNGPKLHYYLGIPLTTNDGYNLGALCVLDKTEKKIEPEKLALLQIIANEVINRLTTMKKINDLSSLADEAVATRKKVAHDIRGPLGGIVGLSQIIRDEGSNMKMDGILEFVNLIEKSSHSLIDLAEEILNNKKNPESKKITDKNQLLDLNQFKEKLDRLYVPQAKMKNIAFTVNTTAKTAQNPFLKTKLLQIAGNLISNAMKFTPVNGQITVELGLETEQAQNFLNIVVKDSGVGLDEKTILYILHGGSTTTHGTSGESGYGLGLPLVRHLVLGLNGTMHISSKPGEGTVFKVGIPQVRV